jgi:sugar lactone lactonase YvrE
VLEENPLPEGRPTNCAFGGPDLRTLYVTSISGHLYRVNDSGRQGALLPPQRRPFTG